MSHLPPHLQRRGFLKLGIASAIVLAVAGGAVALVQPGLVDGKLSTASRLVLNRIAQGMLLGTLSDDAVIRQKTLDGLLDRADALIARLPNHAVAELSQLLSLMATGAGRRWLVGLSTPWETAKPQEVSDALGSMRDSGMALRIQAMQGLHDIVCVPYFCGDEAATFMGYPGPRAV
jgi:hypothetical protein